METHKLGGYQAVLGRVKLIGGEVIAGIRCYPEVSGSGVLDIGFVPDTDTLPNNYSSGTYHISFRFISEFPSYIDMLRNESPVWLYLDTDNPANHGIRTSKEPIGEGE